MSGYKHWRWELDEAGIVWITLDKAKSETNVLSGEVLDECDALLTEIGNSNPQGLVLQSAKQNGFIAGADISEFTTLQNQAEALELIQRGQQLFDRFDALRYPTVVVINGFCMGGGLELSLAFRYRIALDSPKTRLALPEVKLGIHPGFGGMLRLPRLIGPIAALDMILTGRSVDARRAQRIGLVDHVVPERLLQRAAAEMARKRPTAAKPAWWLRLLNQAPLRSLVAIPIRRQLQAKAKQEHYPAPYAALDLWLRTGCDPRRTIVAEGESISRLIEGQTARNLVRVFGLQEQLKGLAKGSDFKAKHMHVIGGGLMGGDIAAWAALQGLKVTVQESNPEALARLLKRAQPLFKRRFKISRLVQGAMDRLIPDPDGHGLARADIIIEAIYEDLDAKRSLFKEVEANCRADALLATNTSSIKLEDIAKALQSPERLVGIHFFNPVAKMPLVEIIRGQKSSKAALSAAFSFARQIDRLPLPVKSSPAFLVNRVLVPYMLEAVELVAEGGKPSAIDLAAVDFGMPVGPIELADRVGLDICLSVAEIMAKPLNISVPEQLRDKVSAGQLGSKSGEGFFKYRDGKRVKSKSERDLTPNPELADRLILRLINECYACLREGVIENGELLDAGLIFGAGFAPFRGGPIHYTEERGKSATVEKLKELQGRYGDRYMPDKGFDS